MIERIFGKRWLHDLFNSRHEPGGSSIGGQFARAADNGAGMGGGNGGLSEDQKLTASMTDSYEKIAKPTILAKQLADETVLKDITIGTERQIKYAKDLRDGFVKTIKSRENNLPVQSALRKSERGDRLNDLEVSAIANDAWDRRTIWFVNTSDAKKVIDWFAGTEGQIRKSDSIGRYKDIIRRPERWKYENGGWKQIFK
jgi:hypothetical protein